MAQVVVATTTWYDSETPRSKLALETIRASAELGYPVSIVDGGSFPEFRSSRRGLPNLDSSTDRDREYAGDIAER